MRPTKWNGPTQPLDDGQRWNVARRLLHDDTLKPEDRLAGLLLLLYAQGSSAIHRLTTEDIEVGAHEVRLHLDKRTCPTARARRRTGPHCRREPQGPRDHRGLGPVSMALPGGQPGRPISTTQLTHRLNQLGIRPNQARGTGLFRWS